MGFEYFDHTADMGLRVYARDLPELFKESALGMFSLIAPLEQFKSQDALDVLLQAENLEELLWKWLRELHYLFSTQKLIFVSFDFSELSEKIVWATCWGQYFDPQKHQSDREIKAVTHHGFKVEKEGNRWKAEVIFDI